MRLFGREISFSRAKERFKGFFDTGMGVGGKQFKRFYPGQFNWYYRCLQFNRMYEEQPLAKQALLSLGGQVVADGIYIQPYTKKDQEPSKRALDAVQVIEEFNDDNQVKQLIRESAFHMGKYGSYFWEASVSPKFGVRAIPMQEIVEPVEYTVTNSVTKWMQKSISGSQDTPVWSVTPNGSEWIIPLHWNISLTSWPYGTSLMTGLDSSFNAMDSHYVNSAAYMEKQAYPYEVLQLGNENYQPHADEVTAVKNKWKNRAVGENIITGYPTSLIQGGTGASPIRELSELINGIKDNITDGMIMPPLSKLYNSTEASATVLTSWVSAVLTAPIREIIAYSLREYVYKPYLEDLGYSVRFDCPTILFEPADAQKQKQMEFWVGMVTAGICPPKVAAEEFGWKDEWEQWNKERKAEQEQIMSQQQNKDESQEADEDDESGFKGKTP